MGDQEIKKLTYRDVISYFANKEKASLDDPIDFDTLRKIVERDGRFTLLDVDATDLRHACSNILHCFGYETVAKDELTSNARMVDDTVRGLYKEVCDLREKVGGEIKSSNVEEGEPLYKRLSEKYAHIPGWLDGSWDVNR